MQAEHIHLHLEDDSELLNSVLFCWTYACLWSNRLKLCVMIVG